MQTYFSEKFIRIDFCHKHQYRYFFYLSENKYFRFTIQHQKITSCFIPRPQNAFSKLTKPTSRVAENVIKTLKIIQLLQQESNRVISFNIIPTTVTSLMWICICCNYAVISSPVRNMKNVVSIIIGKVLGASISSGMILLLIVAFNITGEVLISYSKTVRSWKNQRTSAYCKKVLKSLRPEGVKIGCFMSIGRMGTLNLVMAIIKYTGRLLISLKRKM